MKKFLFVIMFSGFLLSVVSFILASPTGLNNIPTADVVSEKVLVLQGWSNYGNAMSPDFYTGFKFGPIKRIEVGADGKLGSDTSGPVTLQFKYQVWNFDFGLTPLVGVANISTNTEKAGNVDPYLVLTQDLKFFRAHLGHSFQEDNQSFFGGLDKTIKIFNQDLILRADIKQVSDREDWLGSVGFLLTLPYNFIIENWISIPTANDAEEVFTSKMNYVIEF